MRGHYRIKGASGRLELTGRKRTFYPLGNYGLRSSFYTYEYTCGDCGHIGWSRHIEAHNRHATSGGDTNAQDKSPSTS